MSGNMNDDEFNSNLDLDLSRQELFVAALSPDIPKNNGGGPTKPSNPHTYFPDEDSIPGYDTDGMVYSDWEEKALSPQMENVSANDFTYPGPVNQSSHGDPAAFAGDKMDMEDLKPALKAPDITVGNVETWLNGMYTPGPGIADNTIPPQPGPSSMSAALDATYRLWEPADDQVSESSVNTLNTTHSCRTCSKKFGNKDDLRRHKRYSGLKKHICRICGKGFLHFKDLRRHRPTHSANMLQKPCPVDSCTVATGRLDNLKRHIQNKHPEFDIDAWIAEDPKFTPTQRGKHLTRYDQSRYLGADELLEDSITKAKNVGESSKIVGQVDASDDASKTGYEGTLANPPANVLSEVSVPNIPPISVSTGVNPKERKAGELSDITFPDDSLIQSRGIEGVHPERSNASTSQESHQGEALDPVHAQSTYRVPHFARDGHTQAGMDERGLVESNHAISYVNNIKNRFAAQPGIYNQFLEILQAYQRDSMPAKDFHAQMKQLLDSAPDLLEGLEQLVPETAAQHPHGHSDLPPMEAANVQDPGVYDSVRRTGPREPVHEQDTESLAPGSVSDKSPSETAKKGGNSNEIKKYIVESLMQKVHDLLGFNLSDVSESSSSPKSSSDGDFGAGVNDGTLNTGGEPKEEGPYSCPAGSGGSSQKQSRKQKTGASAQSSDNNLHRPLSKSRGKRKKSGGDDKQGDEDDGKGRKRNRTSVPDKDGGRSRRFACPFYKKSPEIHGRNASCLWPGFTIISRLKEHLYRVHVNNVDGGNICPRCRETFENTHDIVRHLARSDRCIQVVIPDQEDGLNEDQVMRLRSRDRGADPEDKWRHIYRICHHLPDDTDTPWPYCDQESPTDQAVEGYDWYQRQHLPNLIREQLEREPEIRHFVERFGDRLPAIIHECQMNLHRRFTSPRTAMDSANEPGSAADSDQPTVQPPNGNADQHPVPPPAAFEAPPNTDNGMSSSEAQQVHAMSNQKGNRNSDSGYGSGVFEPHQSVELHENGHSDPQLFSSGDAPRSGISPGELQHLQDSHQLQDPGIVNVIQNSTVQSTGEGALLGEASGHQMPEWVHDFSSAAVDGQQMVTQNQNQANNPDDGLSGGDH